MDQQILEKVTVHFRSFCPLEEFREALGLFHIMKMGLEMDSQGIEKGLVSRRMLHLITFATKMMEGSEIISDEPGCEVFMDFKCSMAEYAAAFKMLNHGARAFSKNPTEQAEADMAISAGLFADYLVGALLQPGIDYLKRTYNGVFLRDLNNGRISITDAVEFVAQYYYDHGAIYYADEEGRWIKIVHHLGVFLGFAPVRDEKTQRVLDKEAQEVINGLA
jgi:hypothetical protein